jgi:phenylalanyl-tRNA synthetase alpha chain
VREELHILQLEALQAIAAADSAAGLEQARHQYLGKKGALTLVLKGS